MYLHNTTPLHHNGDCVRRHSRTERDMHVKMVIWIKPWRRRSLHLPQTPTLAMGFFDKDCVFGLKQQTQSLCHTTSAPSAVLKQQQHASFRGLQGSMPDNSSSFACLYPTWKQQWSQGWRPCVQQRVTPCNASLLYAVVRNKQETSRWAATQRLYSTRQQNRDSRSHPCRCVPCFHQQGCG